eukprot:TRINITY_DN10300_c0_g3_i1.p1 TRINITY_DN10300_c0_g3~~TRINITY_DN10300_c0_g3_i1.p1  ORF type:complete len:364 (+),score=136.75 TRINITY_DN10300_c0_g3_i1:60-1094(+)
MADPDAFSAAWWAPKLQKYALRCKVIDLSEHPGFLQWLRQGDALVLPKSLARDRPPVQHSDCVTYVGQEVWEGSEASDCADGDVPEFPELTEEIAAAIAEFDGAVFPTSDAKAPADAGWVLLSGSALKCTTVADVVTLMKSSDVVCSDWAARPRPTLVLRKWYSIERSTVWRCLVRGGRLVGASQKCLSEYFPHLTEESVAPAVRAAAAELHSAICDARFPAADYCFDMHVTRRGSPRLLGFHAWAEEELYLFAGDPPAADADGVEVRVVECTEAIPECGVGERMRFGIPAELRDPAFIASAATELDRKEGGAAAASAEELVELLKRAARQAAADESAAAPPDP